MDRAIGKLPGHLKTGGLREHTIVWYYGDNGIPVSGRIPRPRATDLPAVAMDTLPTLCALTGADYA